MASASSKSEPVIDSRVAQLEAALAEISRENERLLTHAAGLQAQLDDRGVSDWRECDDRGLDRGATGAIDRRLSILTGEVKVDPDETEPPKRDPKERVLDAKALKRLIDTIRDNEGTLGRKL